MRQIVALSTLMLICGCAATSRPGTAIDDVPMPPRIEMRGLWVATVANIDWPSRKGLSQKEQ
jgi:hypothetical protein